MGDRDAVRRNRELQRRLYGEPLGDRLRRVLGALGISQAVLAETLGVSSPMLSQLMSGRRAKIGTPAVLGRLVLLEQRIVAGDAGHGEDAVARLLAEVRAAQPRADPPTRPPHPSPHPPAQPSAPITAPITAPTPALVPAPDSYDLLRTVAGPEELARAADTLDRGFPSLAGLLRRAATGDAAGPGRR